ncbi:MAG: flagellar basal body protein [Sphingobium sp.]|jgi:flagellar basal-body rod protein FlgB|nr:flagellar basal body protein [Sphingobium sp.]MCI1271525.1 flagellar basal body protein [Sphingobium sp.]MCI1756833.1 flagellar basal body protein [Sphingobium sp.]MCI2052414.1 flagellar basal body protein [Sphingobium sp.]
MSSLTNAIAQAMRHLGERQRVIAQNIANSDTPGYRAQELSDASRSFATLIEGNPGIARPHVTLSEGMARLGAHPLSTGRIIPDPHISEVKPDGNTVTLEDQVLKMGQIQADYAALTGLYRKQMALVRSALGKGGSA